MQNSVDRRDLGTATGAATFMRSMGGSFGVAIFGAVLSNRLAHNLHSMLPAGATGISADRLKGSPAVILSLPPAIRGPVVHAFARSIDTVFLVAVPVALIGFLMTLLLREDPLRSGPVAAEAGGRAHGRTIGER